MQFDVSTRSSAAHILRKSIERIHTERIPHQHQRDSEVQKSQEESRGQSTSRPTGKITALYLVNNQHTDAVIVQNNADMDGKLFVTEARKAPLAGVVCGGRAIERNEDLKKQAA
jgi:hypothetical protein